jgi:hypothetical protein
MPPCAILEEPVHVLPLQAGRHAKRQSALHSSHVAREGGVCLPEMWQKVSLSAVAQQAHPGSPRGVSG